MGRWNWSDNQFLFRGRNMIHNAKELLNQRLCAGTQMTSWACPLFFPQLPSEAFAFQVVGPHPATH